MKIINETKLLTGETEFDIELTEDEEYDAIEISKIMYPSITDRDEMINKGLEYFIIVGLIRRN